MDYSVKPGLSRIPDSGTDYMQPELNRKIRESKTPFYVYCSIIQFIGNEI